MSYCCTCSQFVLSTWQNPDAYWIHLSTSLVPKAMRLHRLQETVHPCWLVSLYIHNHNLLLILCAGWQLYHISNPLLIFSPYIFFFYTFFSLLRPSFRAPFICFTHSCFQCHGERRSNMKELPYSFPITLTNLLASVPTSSPFFLSVGRLSVFPAQAQPAAVHQFFALMCVQRRLFSSYPHCLCHHISSQIGPASRCCCISFCLVIARCHE